jgi:hypothetical protein
MNRFEKETGDKYWKPAPLLSKLASEGKSFTG